MLGRQHFWRVLQVRPHVLGDSTHTNRSEVVDGESCVLRVVHGENTSEGGLQVGHLEALGEVVDTHNLQHLLQHDLHEDTRGRSCLILVHMHDV